MNTFKGYEVITPKFKSWDKGFRLKVNEKYSVYANWKPYSYMWEDDTTKYATVCLTSELENQFVFGFTKDMELNEAIAFANYLKEKI